MLMLHQVAAEGDVEGHNGKEASEDDDDESWSDIVGSEDSELPLWSMSVKAEDMQPPEALTATSINPKPSEASIASPDSATIHRDHDMVEFKPHEMIIRLPMAATKSEGGLTSSEATTTGQEGNTVSSYEARVEKLKHCQAKDVGWADVPLLVNEYKRVVAQAADPHEEDLITEPNLEDLTLAQVREAWSVHATGLS